MRIDSLRGVLLLAPCVLTCLIGSANSASHTKAPDLVLEATSVTHRSDLQNSLLFVRLTGDEKVEWDEYLSWNKSRRKSATISAEELSSIQRRLVAIDKSGILPQMGPYAGYTDVAIDLNIVLRTPSGEVRFTVTNPWTSDLPPHRDDRVKPIPPQIKSIVCEIWNLHAKFVKMEEEPMCKPPQNPKNNQK